jgi:LPXTG-site transpeptidase (sortase) family protein
VYDVGGDGAMGIPVADCDVVRENFSAFPGYGGYPGSGGTTVLAGHVDYHPHYEAVFWNLRQVQPATEIDYVNKDGKTIKYSVDWAQAITDPNYDWASLAKSSTTESLVLITCDGTFNPDTHEYDRRFVAHATKIS